LFVLTVRKGPDEGQRYKLEPGRTYTVGCNRDADIVLTDPMVLKGHCSIEVADDSVIVRNHTASAGTFVGNKKISQARIKGNAPVRVGDSVLVLQKARAASAASARETGGGAGAPAAGSRSGGGTGGSPARPGAKPSARRKVEPSSRDLTGKIIGGYKLQEVVGRGGMGTVYRATQLSLQRDVALKVLSRELAKDKSFRDLFINEAQSAAQLVHPNVVQVYDAGIEGDVSYFSMEFIHQGSVEEILARDKTIDWREAILMVLEAAHGLQYAESKGIVHRDIKPDNLMLNEDGRIKIADLGLAKRGEGPKDSGVIGTPHFIPPEQALGKEVDGRADQYSLGATFFRMITGRTVFTGKTAKEIVLKHVKEPAPAASSVNDELPGDLDLVLSRMLAKDPDDRYADATELIGALEEVCATHGIKGAIIKKGVSKRVLIPLVLLLLVGGYVIYELATRERTVVVSAGERARRERAERLRKEAEERLERERRENRRSQAQNRKTTLENARLGLDNVNPIKSVFDDKAQAEQKAQMWRDLESRFRAAAEEELFQEFEEELGLAAWAKSQADEIDRLLKKGRASAAAKREEIARKKKEAQELVREINRRLVKLRAEKQFEKALNFAESASSDRYEDDPFRPLLESTIEYGDQTDKVSEIPGVQEIVKAARKDFAKELERILLAFENDWRKVRQQAEQLPEDATDDEIQAAIDDLAAVVKTYIDPDTKPSRRKDKVREARAEAKKLVESWRRRLEERRQQRLENDLERVSRTLRTQASLDPAINPNNVMFCRPTDAIQQWAKEQQEIKTPRFRAFVRERIELLSWYEYLFNRFHSDLQASFGGPRGARPFASLSIEVPVEPGKMIRTAFSKHPNAPGDPYRFGTRRSIAGQRGHAYHSFPLDWVYDRVFYEDGEPRWQFKNEDHEALIRFALGAFCFETMQYEAARKEFERVAALGNERHGPAAKILAARAAREAEAKAAWAEICQASLDPKSVAETKRVAERINEYRVKYADTLFYIEVKTGGWPLSPDFYDPAKAPELPDVPDG